MKKRKSSTFMTGTKKRITRKTVKTKRLELGLFDIPESVLGMVLSHLLPKELLRVQFTCTYFSKTRRRPKIEEILRQKIPSLHEKGKCSIRQELIGEITLINSVAFYQLLRLMEQSETSKSKSTLEVVVRSCGIQSIPSNYQIPEFNKENSKPKGAKATDDDITAEPVKSVLYVNQKGKMKGFRDPYTPFLKSTEPIQEAMRKHARHISWVKLSILQEGYHQIFLKTIKSSSYSGRVRRRIKNYIYAICPQYARFFKSTIHMKTFMLAIMGHAAAQNEVAINWINYPHKLSKVVMQKKSQGYIYDQCFVWGVYWFKQGAAREFGLAQYCLATCLAFPSEQKAQPSSERNVNFYVIYRLYRKAADANIPEAQTNVGMIYYGDFPGNKRNNLIAQDFAVAEHWWRKAAKAGQVDALLNLGLLLRRINKTEESFSFLKQAADKNCARACYLVGRAYETGNGVKQDIGLALEYMNLAKELTKNEVEQAHISEMIELLQPDR